MNRTNKRSNCSSAGDGNTKASPAKHWIITMPVTKDLESQEAIKTECLILYNNLKGFCDKFAFQVEKGKETGYLHYQIYLKSKDKIRLSGIKKKLRNAHCEKCRNIDASEDYCLKEDTRYDPFLCFSYDIDLERIKRMNLPNEREFYCWQIKIMNIIKSDPDDRTIYWFWEPDGKSGKTKFCKYLTEYHGAVGIEGKGNDIKYICATKDSEIYLFDFPRDYKEYVNYQVIESIKNGYYTSGKYESVSINRPSPHVFIFANFPPNESKLSKDRWHIHQIGIDDI